jgi:hypothetical protein
VEVDVRAQNYRRQLESQRGSVARNPRFFSEPAALFIDGVKVSRLDQARIMEVVTLPALRAYWARRLRLTDASSLEVDWSSLSRAMKALPAYLQRWIVKHTVGMCGVGKFRLLWKMDTKGACPRCSECPLEDHLHIPRCTGPTATAEWDKRHKALRTWMTAHHTSPEIEWFIYTYLKTIRSPIRGVPSVRIWSSHPALLRRAIASQAIIGPQGLLEGLLSKEWRQLQQLHFQSQGSRKSAHLWASRLVQQLIALGRYMWEDRNRIFHSEDNLQYSSRKREVDISIREQYSMGTRDLPPTIRRMLTEPLPDVLRRPLESREHWLRLVSRERALLRRSLARQRQMIYELAHHAPPSRTRHPCTSS